MEELRVPANDGDYEKEEKVQVTITFDDSLATKCENKEERFKSEFEKTSFQCDKCGMVFNKYYMLAEHNEIHKEIECPICSLLVKCQAKLKLHMLTHTGIRPHECKKCRARFRLKTHLEVHEKTEGANCDLMPLSETLVQVPPYLCKFCLKSFHSLSNARRHLIKTHSGEICEFCRRPFSRNCAELRHQIDLLKPYECEACCKRFSFSAHLRKHLMAHKNHKFSGIIKPQLDNHNTHEEVTNVCNVCQRSFKLSSNLTRHMRTHTGEKPYQCMYCPKRFSQSNSLKVHIRTHTGERPYSCKTCQRTFVEPKGLRKHSCNVESMLLHS